MTDCFIDSGLDHGIFLNSDISQGSIATQLRCGEIISQGFVANLLMNLSVKEIWKSVNIWRSYGQYCSALFFLTHSVVWGVYGLSQILGGRDSILSQHLPSITWMMLANQVTIACRNATFLQNVRPVFSPHHSTTYVGAAYSYRPSSMVCLSVGLSVTLVSPAKTAAPIELPFGLRTCVGPGNHVLDGGPDPPWEGANFWGRMDVPL